MLFGSTGTYVWDPAFTHSYRASGCARRRLNAQLERNLRRSLECSQKCTVVYRGKLVSIRVNSILNEEHAHDAMRRVFTRRHFIREKLRSKSIFFSMCDRPSRNFFSWKSYRPKSLSFLLGRYICNFPAPSDTILAFFVIFFFTNT